MKREERHDSTGQEKVVEKTAGLSIVVFWYFRPSVPIRFRRWIWKAAGSGPQSSSALEAFGKRRENGESQTATASDASRQETKASLSNAVRAINSLGNIWDSWSGKTSFEFLNGTQGMVLRAGHF